MFIVRNPKKFLCFYLSYIAEHGATTVSITTFGSMTLSIMAFSIMTLSIKGLFATLS